MEHLLNSVDCAGFNPAGVAPETNSKEEMKRFSASSLENWMFDLVNNLEGAIYFNGAVLQKHWFTAQEIVEVYQEETGNKCTPKAMTTVLGVCGSFNVQTRVIRPEKGDTPYPTRLWCVRDIPKWKHKMGRQKTDLFNRAVKNNYEGDREAFSKIMGGKRKEAGK